MRIFRLNLNLLAAATMLMHPLAAQTLPAPARQNPPAGVRPTARPTVGARPTARPTAAVRVQVPGESARDAGPGDEPVVLDGDAAAGNIAPAWTLPASVGGVPVAGLTDAVALEQLKEMHGYQLRQQVVVLVGPHTLRVPRQELGATLPWRALLQQARQRRGNIPLRFQVDEKKALLWLEGVRGRLQKAVQHSRINKRTGERISAGTDGLEMAVGASFLRIRQALEASPPQQQIELVTQSTPAGVVEVEVEPPVRAGGYLIASYSTPYNAALRGRTRNLRKAAEEVNGTLVPPGAIFSANRAIGRRRAEDGWREAKMFMGGRVVTGTGAGICQCSTTIYNAALLAGLPIVERHPHSFRVTYAPPSRDAAIYWGSKDMRFRNNTGHTLRVETFVSGGRFHARIYGQQPRTRLVEVESQTLSRRNGTRSVAYRLTRGEDGKVIRELLSRDYYRPQPD